MRRVCLPDGLRFGSTVLTENLIRYISDSQAYNTTPSAERIGKGPGSIGIGLAYAIAIPIMLQIAALSEQWGMAVEREAGESARQSLQTPLGQFELTRSLIPTAWILRASLWDLIAKKALRMSPRARLINTTGRMTTALSADAMLIQEGIPWIADLFGLFNIALGAGLLARLLGPSAFVGVGMYLAMWPIFAFIIAKQVKYRKIQLKAVDGRVNVMTEILKRVAGVVSEGILRGIGGPGIIQTGSAWGQRGRARCWGNVLILICSIRNCTATKRPLGKGYLD